MATYAIGDIQGCYATFQRLLERIAFDRSRDRLWLVGDLVNRGPRSLETLQWARDHDDCLTVVLGNHDLHLLAAALGVRKLKRLDTLEDILAAKRGGELIDWLRHQPLIHVDGNDVLVHAGLLPEWSVDDACAHARTLESALRNGDGKAVLRALQTPPPGRWRAALKGSERLAFIAAVLTRIRVCRPKGKLHASFTGPLESVPEGYAPWFRAPDRRSSGYRIVFGHWSALGLYLDDGVRALDTGCVWGRTLTALRLDDEQVFSVPYAEEQQAPEASGENG